jgi:RNA polymerase sigma-70 factor (ECF subfamily)
MYLVTGNVEEAEEVTQDAFLALWERWERVGVMEDPTGYLFRTALNRFRSRRRRTARAARKILGRVEGGDAFAQADERDALARALAALPARQRAAIVLTELLGYSSEEAGRILGVKDVTVRSLASQARSALRTNLEGPDE